jgi:FlaA1/EpsC-like NDP-sugar epimerase
LNVRRDWVQSRQQRLAQSLLGLPRVWKRLLLVLSDGALIAASVWAAFALRLGDPWSFYLDRAVWLFPLVVVTTLPVCYAFGFYRSLLRYVSGQVYFEVARGLGVGLLLTLAVWTLAQGPLVPRSTWLIYLLVAVLLIGSQRLLLRGFVSVPRGAFATAGRVAIYGAGEAGAQLAAALLHSREFHPAVFVDDQRELRGSYIHGLKVYQPERLADLIARFRIGSVLLALPSVSRARRREIIESLESLPVRVLGMPGLDELAGGLRRVDELREVEVEDVLGRDTVAADPGLLSAILTGKNVLVTGGGGSIGSQLCRQVLQQAPQRLVLVESSEYQLYNAERELEALALRHDWGTELIPILASVQNRERMRAVMEAFDVDTVFHAAAYKHVPIVERNPLEGVANNVFGTWYCAEAAIASGVGTFVLVSTDKAVRPTNVMGASKRLAELLLQGLAQLNPGTRLCMVRFGNVLASSGSVVPLFREQIRRGGPVTVTHPEVVRYFMTIPEAAQLVIQAGAMAQGGDVFLLQMGEPVRIVDLARRLIHLSGFEVRDEENPDGDIEILFSGLRPGEKLYEELLIDANDLATSHPQIMRAREESLPWPQVQEYLRRLQAVLRDGDQLMLRQILSEAVGGYTPWREIEDRVWVQRRRGDNASTGA